MRKRDVIILPVCASTVFLAATELQQRCKKYHQYGIELDAMGRYTSQCAVKTKAQSFPRKKGTEAVDNAGVLWLLAGCIFHGDKCIVCTFVCLAVRLVSDLRLRAVTLALSIRDTCMNWSYLALAALGAYLLGSIPFAVVVSRVMRLKDPRTFGSGNPGATNVLRSGSKLAAVLTLVLDAAKGWLPVALVGWYGGRYGLWEGAQALVGLAAFVGHVWPVFLRFKGGKGVATAVGVLLGISGWLGLAAIVVWVAVLALSRMSSLSSLVAAISLPVVYLLGGGPLWDYNRTVLAALVVMVVILVYRHSANISRLLAGTEPRVGQSKKAAISATAAKRSAKKGSKAR